MNTTFDGDMISANMIMSEEANQEIHEFLNSPRSVFNSQKELLVGSRDDLIGYTLLMSSLS